MARVGRQVRGGDDRGAVTIIVAVFIVSAMILLAFVIDRGISYAARSELQNAADAAALAGAQELCANTPDAGYAAAMTAAQNYAASNGVTVDPTDPDQLQVVTNGTPPFVSVAGSKTVNSFFGAFTGVPQVFVAARATSERPCVRGFALFSENTFTMTGTGGGNAATVEGAPAYAGSVAFTGNGQGAIFPEGLYSPDGSGEKWFDGTAGQDNAIPITSQGTAAAYATSIGLTDYINSFTAPVWYTVAPDGKGECLIDAVVFTAAAGYQGIQCAGAASVVGMPSAINKIIKANSIDFAGDVGWNGSSCTSSVLIYATGSGGVTNQGAPADLCGSIYAPSGLYLSGGNLLNIHDGRIIAQSITVKGGGNGGLLVSLTRDSILGPGDVRLSQ